MLKLLSTAALIALFSLPHAASAQTPWPCPKGVPTDVACFQDHQPNGAYVLAAVPAAWDGVLIVHAHGGPRTTPISPDNNDEDLGRFNVLVRERHAWVNSSYRRPGFGVKMAVEDTEAARLYFMDKIAPMVGQPRLVLAHGQSWGGNVAAKLVEMDAKRPPGERAYRGALLTSAVLPGGARGYWFRADLRAVYQYVCKNHPRPDEPQHPVATGLPAGSTMKEVDLKARIDDCTGVSRPAASRTHEQAQALADILGVVPIVESSLVGHMTWATFLFQDLVHERFAGNPFSNIGVVYKGSHDDTALNAGVERFASDARARAAMDEDGALTGAIAIPVVTMHATRDPTAFVENESAYRELVEAAGNGDKLVQVFVDEAVHSKFLTPQYPAALDALIAWVEKGERPSSETVAARCPAMAATYGESCTFVTNFKPAPYYARVLDRMP